MTNKQQWNVFLVLIGVIMILSLLVFFSKDANAQTVTDSPHDLSSGLSTNADNNEVCVYCHTPHGGSNADGPLWNKPSTGNSYTLYDSTTIDGVVLADGPGGTSLACLSCHDGTQALDVVINAPGSGSVTNILQGSVNIGTGLSNIGTDLTNDHPIAIQYGGFDPGSGQIDPDFIVPQDNGQTDADRRWWVDVVNGTKGNVTIAGQSGVREKTDMILYTRLNGANYQPYIECGSCHDPHSGNGTGSEGGNTLATAEVGSDVNFMRIDNVNSNVCLACHIK
jgi:hypothetical protein